MQDYIEVLKGEVLKIFGSNIQVASDCEQLANQIQTSVNITISSQTLRRLFGKIEYQSKPSIYTLNTLSKYIGYLDYNDFINKHNAKTNCKPNYDFALIEKLFVNNKHNESSFLLWHEGISSILIQTILSNKNTLEQFTNTLNKNTGAMIYVWCNYYYYDLVNTNWYMRCFRIFCNNSKILHHYLLLQTIEYFACILNNKQEQGAGYIIKIKELLPKVRAKYGCIFPLEGAVFGCLIANATYNNNKYEVDKLINEVCTIYNQNISNIFFEKSTITHNTILNTLIEILILMGLYEQAYYLITTLEYKATAQTAWYYSEKEIVNLSTAIILFQNNEVKQAKKLFDAVNIENIRFDRKTLNTLHYLTLKLGFTSKTAIKSRNKIIAEINTLSNKVDMLCFKNLIPNF